MCCLFHLKKKEAYDVRVTLTRVIILYILAKPEMLLNVSQKTNTMPNGD